jgi:hypothetical protein
MLTIFVASGLVAIILVIVLLCCRNGNHEAGNMHMTRDWYKMQFPECVRDNVIICRSCGSRNIRIERTRRYGAFNPFSRTIVAHSHVCGNCAATIYYTFLRRK